MQIIAGRRFAVKHGLLASDFSPKSSPGEAFACIMSLESGFPQSESVLNRFFPLGKGQLVETGPESPPLAGHIEQQTQINTNRTNTTAQRGLTRTHQQNFFFSQ